MQTSVHVAVWTYLLIAFVFVPVYVPLAVWTSEPRGGRRNAMAAFVVLGGLVSAGLLAAMLPRTGGGDAGGAPRDYSTDLHAGGLVVAAYVVATCGALLLSGYRDMAVFARRQPRRGGRHRPADDRRVRLVLVCVGGDHERCVRAASALRPGWHSTAGRDVADRSAELNALRADT